MTRFFRYSGSKIKYREEVNKVIKKTNKLIYAEPFVGSGAILFGLEEEFDKYVINDIDRNVIHIYRTFKKIKYEDYVKKIKFVEKKFGDIKNDKESYYEFRNWFNKKHWNTGTNDEGIFLHFLANSCINSFLRFGPNGMNQGFGGRFYKLNEEEFNKVKRVLRKTTIYNKDFKFILEKYGKDAFYFLDPPYWYTSSHYGHFDGEEDINYFIKFLKGKHYVYTDVLSDFNEHIKNKKVFRNMKTTNPNSDKDETGRVEYLFSNFKFN